MSGILSASGNIDKLSRFNCYFGKELFKYQPISEDANTTLNLMRYRSLEGFVASVTPFNFTAIAGNLAYTPCIMVTFQNKLLLLEVSLSDVATT